MSAYWVVWTTNINRRPSWFLTQNLDFGSKPRKIRERTDWFPGVSSRTAFNLHLSVCRISKDSSKNWPKNRQEPRNCHGGRRKLVVQNGHLRNRSLLCRIASQNSPTSDKHRQQLGSKCFDPGLHRTRIRAASAPTARRRPFGGPLTEKPPVSI